MPTQSEINAINKIADQIKTGKVIPIIGYDLLFHEFDTNNVGDDLLKSLIKIHAHDDNLENTLRDAQTENGHITGNELLNSYYHRLDVEDKNSFKVSLSNTILDQRFNLQLIPESLRKLVSIKYFKLFINATFTNSLELALNTYRAEGRDEQEIKSSYTVLNYHPNTPEDLPEQAPDRFYINLNKPHIYNLFGTHDSQDHEYVLTDADYIELIYDLIAKKKEKFKNLLSYLNGRGAYLLFLGCNFPDWFFRLFIRICVGDRLDMASTVELKAVIDNLNMLKLDPSRTIFIDRYKIQKLDINCNLLVDEVYKIFLHQQGTPHLVNKQNNNVFISYCRKDEQVAGDVANQFDINFIEYFLDSQQLKTGDALTQRIKDEIDKACVFMPVVSNNLQSASDYFCLEWAYALHKEKEIWPIFKEFPDQNIPLPCGQDKLSEIRDKILNKDNKLGIRLDDNNLIDIAKLADIKRKQYLCRTSGK